MVFPSLPSESENILDTGDSPSELMSGLRGTLFNLKWVFFPFSISVYLFFLFQWTRLCSATIWG